MLLDFKIPIAILFMMQYFEKSNYFVINNKRNAVEILLIALFLLFYNCIENGKEFI
jgi:hypothetical protein|tara:strand:- start:291 stop:458 length:168 start_codon:yes stop_codon:yes gene_type:complete